MMDPNRYRLMDEQDEEGLDPSMASGVYTGQGLRSPTEGMNPYLQNASGFDPSGIGTGAGIGSGVGGFIGGIFGNEDAKGDQARTLQSIRDAMGVRASAADAGKSAVLGMDPATRGAQMDVLAKLRGLGATGYDATDQGAINRSLQRAGTASRGAREAALARAQATGMGGGSNELLADLTGGQEGYDTAGIQSGDIAASGRQRALDALKSAGGLAGNIRQGDYEGTSAQDLMARYNASNKQAVNMWNANNQVAGNYGLSKYYQDAADRTRKQDTGIGAGIGGIVGGVAGGLF